MMWIARSNTVYLRRNTLGISGVRDAENEGIVKVSFDVRNEQMKLDPTVVLHVINRVPRIPV